MISTPNKEGRSDNKLGLYIRMMNPNHYSYQRSTFVWCMNWLPMSFDRVYCWKTGSKLAITTTINLNIT